MAASPAGAADHQYPHAAIGSEPSHGFQHPAHRDGLMLISLAGMNADRAWMITTFDRIYLQVCGRRFDTHGSQQLIASYSEVERAIPCRWRRVRGREGQLTSLGARG